VILPGRFAGGLAEGKKAPQGARGCRITDIGEAISVTGILHMHGLSGRAALVMKVFTQVVAGSGLAVLEMVCSNASNVRGHAMHGRPDEP